MRFPLSALPGFGLTFDFGTSLAGSFLEQRFTTENSRAALGDIFTHKKLSTALR
jgi:hypothetical protein